MKSRYKILFVSFLLFFSSLLLGNEKVVLQLKWLHQFQFAGYYAAKEKGFYNDVGLDVEIKERDISKNNIQEVIDGKAEYGIADSVLFLYQAKKEPVVLISPIFQHSPGVIIYKKSTRINSVYDLSDKKMSFYKNDTDGFSLLAMLKKFQIKPKFMNEREKSDYLKLANDEIDAMFSYLTNEPFYFKQKNIAINIIDPRNYGFDLYGDMIFTNKNEADNHPQRVKKFKEASIKGWEYALTHKKEIIELINKKYSKKSIEHLTYEANIIEKMINKDVVPLGTIDKGRILYINNLYKEYGVSNSDLNEKGFMFEKFKDDENSIKLSDEEKTYLKEHPVLTIPNLNTFPPFNFNENDQAKGYSIDFMNLIGNHIGVDFKPIKNKSWKEYLNMLKMGTLDIMPHLALTEERKEFAEFTNFAHIKYLTALSIRKNDNIQSMKDLENRTLAVVEKSFVETFIRENFPKQRLFLASSTNDALEAVSLGNADAVMGNTATFNYYMQDNWLSNIKIVHVDDLGFQKFTELFMAVTKGNTILKSILEKATSSIPPNEIAELRKKWMDTKLNKKEIFTKEQNAYLKNKKILTMCVDPNRMPYEEIKKGKYRGITSEYIKLFSGKLPIPIKLVPTKTWVETLEYAEQRKCDFITVLKETENRKKYFNFSNIYLKSPLIITTKINEPFINDISEVLNKRIGIVKGYAYKENLKNKYSSINIVDVDTLEDGLKQVKEGKLFAFIDTLSVVGYNIQKKYIGELKIAGTIDNNSNFSIASRNDEPLLNEIFSILIKNISQDQKNQILNKWISVKYQDSVDYKKVLTLSIIFLLILLIVLYKNNAIKKINKKMGNYISLVDRNIITSTTDIHGVITACSQAFSDISGYHKDELLGVNHNILKHPDMQKETFIKLWKVISNGKTWKGEIKNKTKNGGCYWVETTISPIYDDFGKIISYTSISQDITNKKMIEEISIRDGLTNIFNRRHFDDIFPKYISTAKRNNEIVSFIIMDIDFFKQYNDNYGHQKGDETLISIATSLSNLLLRSDDYCFRLGGEEFGILYKTRSREGSLSFAEKIRKNIENLNIEHKYSNISKYITVSLGLYSNFASGFDDVDRVYKKTDDLLYKAKREGRNKTFQNNIS